MQIYLFIIALWVGIYTHSTSALASAWGQKEGKAEISATEFYYSSDRFFDLQGQEQRQGRFVKYETQFYGEYGLSDDITIGGSYGLQYVAQDDFRGNFRRDNIGISDPRVFAQKRFYRDDIWVVGARGSLKLPSYFRTNAPPKGGSDSTDASLELLAGYSFEMFGRWHYADFALGYNARSGNAKDQYIASGQIGYNLSDSFTLISAFSNTLSETLPDATNFNQSGAEDFDLQKIEFGARYRLNEKYVVSASYFEHINGKNTGSGDGLSFGISSQF